MATPNAAEIQYQLSHIHDDRSRDIVSSNIVCGIIAIIAVTLRLASRRLCKAAILADDYVCLAALVSSFLMFWHVKISNSRSDLASALLMSSYWVAFCSFRGDRRSDVYVVLLAQSASGILLIGFHNQVFAMAAESMPFFSRTRKHSPRYAHACSLFPRTCPLTARTVGHYHGDILQCRYHNH